MKARAEDRDPCGAEGGERGESSRLLGRRSFLQDSGHGLGALALGSLLFDKEGRAATVMPQNAKVRRVISLFMSGGPSQMDLLDPKPGLEKERGKELPPSVRGEQRITTMTSGQKELPVLPSPFKFSAHGQSGLELSELLPHWGDVADDLCVIRSMKTEAINHDPAITFFQTGFQLAGRPSIGSWVSYGLGALNRDLPAYIVLTSRSTSGGAQPLYSRLWNSGFLPAEHSGVKLRNTGDPVYFLENPPGIDRGIRRDTLDDLQRLNQKRHAVIGDPAIESRIAQYEMAFRMQASVPELADISKEPEHVLKLYGPNVGKQGSFARNCLVARRLAERDVRFIQLFHMGWDQHDKLKETLSRQCRDTEQPVAGLIKDLKQRGLLKDTLVVWGGEFGRTTYAQKPGNAAGRDHHPGCFTQMLAGAGVRGGHVHGATDDYCYNVTQDPVHVHDLNATLMHLLGVDHKRLTFKFQGRDYRLTDVHGQVVKKILT